MNWYKKAQIRDDDPYDPETINKNMDDFHSQSQNHNPDAPDFAVDSRLPMKAIPASVRKSINGRIHDLGNYHTQIPLQDIFDICKDYDVIAIQEDGAKWSGFLVGGGECGSDKAQDQHAEFDLAIKLDDEFVPAKNNIILTWCVMHGSGRYEIVCYIS